MKIIAFIEAHQEGTIRKILEHCGLWEDPPPRAPPPRLPQQQADLSDSRRIAEVDPDFLEFSRHEQMEQMDLPLQPA
jgi:hypothetical protein